MSLIAIALLVWVAPAILLGLVILWMCFLRPGAGRATSIEAGADHAAPEMRPELTIEGPRVTEPAL